jgi:hypothetical protein
VIGGTGGLQIERATIGEDGSLGQFAILPSVSLSLTRFFCTSTVSRDALYIIGGTNGNTQSTSAIEFAHINSDNSISTFTADAVFAPRLQASSPTIGPYVYLIGGSDPVTNTYVTTIDRAVKNGNGALDFFSDVPGATLNSRSVKTARIADYLYSFGLNSDVQRAKIATDGSIGAFASVDIGMPPSGTYFGNQIVSLGNYVYLVGGIGGRAPLNTLRRAELR